MAGLFDGFVQENPTFVDNSEKYAKRAELARDEAVKAADEASKSEAIVKNEAGAVKVVGKVVEGYRNEVVNIHTHIENDKREVEAKVSEAWALSKKFDGDKEHVDNVLTSVNSLKVSVDNAAKEVIADRDTTKKYRDEALSYKNSANSSATAAKTSEDKAKVSETNSKSSETKTATMEANVKSIEANLNGKIDTAQGLIDQNNATLADVKSTQDRVEAFQGEVIKAKDDAANSAAIATDKASEAVLSEGKTKGYHDDTAAMYEDIKAGQVYRGAWDATTNAYPDHKGLNSVWDVILPDATSTHTFDGKKWKAGDRVVYAAVDKKFYQLVTSRGVDSVNGKTGSVTLNASDVGAVSKTGDVVSGVLAVSDKVQIGTSADGKSFGSPVILGQMNDYMEIVTPTNTSHNSATGIAFHHRNSGTAALMYKQDGGNASYFNLVSDEPNYDLRVGGKKVYHEGFKPDALPSHGFGMGNKQGGAIYAQDYTEDKTRDFNKLLTAGEYTVEGNWLNGATNVATAVSHTGIVKVEVRNLSSGPSYVQTFKSISNGLVNENVRSGTGTAPNGIAWTTWNKAGRYEQELGHRLTINRTNSTGAPYITLKKREERTDLTSGWYTFGSLDLKIGDGTYDPNNPNAGALSATIVGARQWDNKRNRLVINLRGAIDNNTKSEVVLYEDGVNLICGGKAVRYNGTDLLVDNKKVYHEGLKPTAADVGAVSKSGDTITGNTFVDRGENSQPFLGVRRGTRETRLYDSGNNAGLYVAGGGTKDTVLISTSVANDTISIGSNDKTLNILGKDETFTYKGKKVYTEDFKPDALPSHGFGMGGRQGSALEAKNFTEDKTEDFNKLLTAGEYTVSGSWINSINNKGTGTAENMTGIVKVEVRKFPSGPAYIQTYTYITSEAVNRVVRGGSGEYPNITWKPWRRFGPYETNVEYRMCIDRDGDTVYPYTLLNKNTLRTDATDWYTVGEHFVKVGPKSNDADPASGKHVGSLAFQSSKDNKEGRVYLFTKNFDTNSITARMYMDGVDGIRWQVSGKYMTWNKGVLNIDGTGNATGGFHTGSDLRFKDKIEPMSKYSSGSWLDKVCALETNSFVYKNKPDDVRLGYIAQDVQQVIPEAVSVQQVVAPDAKKNDEMVDRLFIDPMAIIAAQNEAIKELTKRLEALEAKQ